MFPCFAGNDSVNHLRGYAKPWSNISFGIPQEEQFSDAQYLGFCEFTASPVSFSSGVCAVKYLIGFVVDVSIPAKILQSVIRGVAVVVTAFHSFGTWTYEGKHNQMMDLVLDLFSVFRSYESYCVSSCFGTSSLVHDSTFDGIFHSTTPTSTFDECSDERFDSAPVRDAVKPFVSRNVSPELLGSVRVGLNSFVEGFALGVVLRHCRFPLAASCVEDWAGSRNYYFSDRRPSLCCSMKSLFSDKGDFQWN